MHVCCVTRITLAHAVKGGMEVHTDALARGLAARGHQVTIVTTARADGIPEETLGSVRTIYVPGTTPGRYSHSWGHALPGALHRLHAETPIDVIWGEGGGAYYYLRWHGNPLGVPVVTFLQGTYLGEIGTMWNLARATGAWGRFVRYLPWRTVQYFRWDLWYTHGATAVIGASRENAALARWGYVLPRAKLTASINGIDVTRFTPDPALGRRARAQYGLGEAPVLLHAGRLEPEKGSEIALRAFARVRGEFPSTRLLLAGDGSLSSRLRAEARSLGVDDGVQILGHVPNAEIHALYNACTVFLYPTLAVESFGIGVAEAMACGRPVVASRLGGVRTSIDDGDNGVLVPAGDVAALATAVGRLLADPWERDRLGAAARKKAVQALSVGRMVDDVLGVLERVTRGRR